MPFRAVGFEIEATPLRRSLRK